MNEQDKKVLSMYLTEIKALLLLILCALLWKPLVFIVLLLLIIGSN